MAVNQSKLLRVWKWAYEQHYQAFHRRDYAAMDRFNSIFVRAERLRKSLGL